MYPRRLCRDICIGISNQRRADELGVVGKPVLIVATMGEIATSARARARRSVSTKDIENDVDLLSAEIESDPSAALHHPEPYANGDVAFDDVSGESLEVDRV